jgi:glucokinase
MNVLAGDVGGTKSFLLFAECLHNGCRTIASERFHSGAYPELAAPISEFMRGNGIDARDINHACMAIAGPVHQDQHGATASLTNLPWRIDNRQLAQQLGLDSVDLINDFQAIAYGLEALEEEDFHPLQEGQALPAAPRLVIGAGTGLGVCIVQWDRDRYTPLASEGGHVNFAPTSDLEQQLLGYLQKRYGRVSSERILSGPGLVGILEFLVAQGHGQPGSELARAMQGSDPARAISDAARQQSDPLAVQALNLFVRVYGNQAGDFALTVLPRGGVFIAGGIAPQIVDLMERAGFMHAFRNKGRMSQLMSAFPVKVVMNPQVGLLGAARFACRHATVSRD